MMNTQEKAEFEALKAERDAIKAKMARLAPTGAVGVRVVRKTTKTEPKHDYVRVEVLGNHRPDSISPAALESLIACDMEALRAAVIEARTIQATLPKA